MTENEAIKSLEYAKRIIGLPEQGEKWSANRETIAIDVAIKAIEEIQQYRTIGTVEECWEARERQKAKKIIFNSEDDREYEDYICPNCEDVLQQRKKGAIRITICKLKFCPDCGQHLDW